MLQNKNILFLWRGCQSNQWYTFRGKSAKKWKTAHPNATTKSTWHQPFLNFIQHGYDKIVYQNDQIKSISWFVLDIKILAFLFGLGTVCRLLNRSLFNMMFQNETSYLVSLELSCYSNKHYWVWWLVWNCLVIPISIIGCGGLVLKPIYPWFVIFHFDHATSMIQTHYRSFPTRLILTSQTSSF
jgi:hypothetical protein